MSSWPSSLRARLTLWYSALLGLPLIVFAVICYLVFARALLDRTDLFIGDALTAFTRELAAERRSALTPEQAMRTTVDEVRFRDLHIMILDGAGHVVATTALPQDRLDTDWMPPAGTIARIVEAIRDRGMTESFALTFAGGHGAYRALSRPLLFGGRRFGLSGTYSLDDIASVLERIRGMFLIAIPVLILCAATGGYLLAKRSLAPVSAMAEQAAEISAANLHQRLPVAGGDELVRLARVVNGLLDRLESFFEQQRRFVADASHELRTPAAILRTESDVTLAREHRTEEEYRTSATIVQNASRRLTRIVDDLFLLARTDSGHLVPRSEALYLEELVHEVTRAIRPVADRKSVRVELRQVIEAPFDGDADLLGRLLLNLVDNAIKHSPDGGTIEVGITRRNGDYEIAVVDEGSGIPSEARERVFERFFRVDAARSRSDNSTTSGAGLGLAIARRIAELHGGRLDLAESRTGRTEFRVTLPIKGVPV